MFYSTDIRIDCRKQELLHIMQCGFITQKKLIILSFSVKMIDRQLPTMIKGDNIQETNSIAHQTNAGGGRETRCRIQKLMQKCDEMR